MVERKLLNERFKVVFEALAEKGEVVKSSRKKGISNFAEKITGKKAYGHIIRACLDGKRYITYQQAHLLVKHYQVSPLYLFEGQGAIFANMETEQLSNNGSPKSDTPIAAPSEEAYQPNHKPNVIFSTQSAFASSTVEVGVQEDSERFYIPGMQGEHIAFYIKGASMSPTIADGDMVICRAIDTNERIVDNEIYAIVTSSGNVMVKRVQKILNKTRQVKGIKCISDNYLEHDPFTLAIHEVRKLLKVERKLTDVGL
jgi:phage repressor protein C with HTH and peptisase S24 domain